MPSDDVMDKLQVKWERVLLAVYPDLRRLGQPLNEFTEVLEQFMDDYRTQRATIESLERQVFDHHAATQCLEKENQAQAEEIDKRNQLITKLMMDINEEPA